MIIQERFQDGCYTVSANVATMRPNDLYHVFIRAHADRLRKQNTVEQIEYTNVRYDQLIRWSWFFEYRSALLKIKYPKSIVIMHLIRYNTKKTVEIDWQRKISNAKGQVTKVQNVVNKMQKKYDDDLFCSQTMTIQEYYPRWDELIAKLQKKKDELKAVINNSAA